MPQVMIALSVKDYKTLTTVWKMAKKSLNPHARRRIGWRGRSSIMREFILYGFEEATKDPQAFLRIVRETSDPLVGKKGRKDKGAERREGLVPPWQLVFPNETRAAKPRKGSSAE
ncbi:MAG: hypothetical protein M1144_01675 [Candidatus Thermoplasmatota archaeon]|nr:hypothetical protein [Candidatus Thermoplasmatota archaeon]MCL5984716.1 hypothetical protein [Candidatus Thermoplasmatota archaeon]